MSESEHISVGTVQVRGRDFPVVLDPRSFRFATAVGAVRIEATNREDLEKRISQEVTRQRVEHRIPVVLQTPGGYERAILRGRNERTGEALFTRVSDGEKFAEKHPTVVALGQQVSDADLAEMNRLHDAFLAARAAEYEYLRQRVPKGQFLSAWSLLNEAEQAAVAAATP